MGKRFYRGNNIILRPYSLVEMLVVIAIIAILIGIGAGGYTIAQKWMAKSRTEAILAKLKIALEAYKNDKGYYPLPNTDPSRVPPVTGTLVISTADAPNFRLDVNIKDYAAIHPNTFGTYLPNSDLTSSDNDHLQIRNNMNKYVDYSKIQQDQSVKVPNSKYNEYFVKDGWNSPVESESSPSPFAGAPCGPIKYRSPGIINKTSFDLYSAGPDRKFATDPAKDIEDDIYCKL